MATAASQCDLSCSMLDGVVGFSTPSRCKALHPALPWSCTVAQKEQPEWSQTLRSSLTYSRMLMWCTASPCSVSEHCLHYNIILSLWSNLIFYTHTHSAYTLQHILIFFCILTACSADRPKLSFLLTFG